jgi:hypothetical protein
METTTHHGAELREAATGPAFVSLESKTVAADASRTFPTLAELVAAEKKDHTTLQQRELGEKQRQGAPPTFPPLDRETRVAVDTATAAYHLNRQPQTLRGWACHEDGPLRPVRVHGRLAWPVAELRRVLGLA